MIAAIPSDGVGLLILLAAAILVVFAYDLLRWAFANEQRKNYRLIERINHYTGNQA